MSIIKGLKAYLKSTSKKQIQKDWNALSEYDNDDPIQEYFDYIESQKEFVEEIYEIT